MNPRQRIEIIQRLSEIERGRLGYQKGKLSYRDLTPKEDAEISNLRNSLEPKFSSDEMDLFSGILESSGMVVVPLS